VALTPVIDIAEHLTNSSEGNFTKALLCAINEVTLVPVDRMDPKTNTTSVLVTVTEFQDAKTTLYIIVGVILGVFAIVFVVGMNELRKSRQRAREDYRIQEDEKKPFKAP
jgi:H+/Cl- antiporter ClcA